jgi:hypothetical protein
MEKLEIRQTESVLEYIERIEKIENRFEEPEDEDEKAEIAKLRPILNKYCQLRHFSTEDVDDFFGCCGFDSAMAQDIIEQFPKGRGVVMPLLKNMSAELMANDINAIKILLSLTSGGSSADGASITAEMGNTELRHQLRIHRDVLLERMKSRNSSFQEAPEKCHKMRILTDEERIQLLRRIMTNGYFDKEGGLVRTILKLSDFSLALECVLIEDHEKKMEKKGNTFRLYW